MSSFHLETKSLPDCLLRALCLIGYGGRDIRIETRQEFTPCPPSADGRRGYLMAVNLTTGETETKLGSWGGSNMFTKTVDDIRESSPIPADFAFITGMISSGPGYPATACVYVSPTNINPKLLPISSNLSARESIILYAVKGYKSAYRKQLFEQWKVSEGEIDSLVKGEFISRNKAGAISITTKGRNAAAKNDYKADEIMGLP